MYWPSADFSGRFGLRGKLYKTFNIIVSTIYLFLNLDLWEGGCSLGVPIWVRPWTSYITKARVKSVNVDKCKNALNSFN
jgi:hypothetical protein